MFYSKTTLQKKIKIVRKNFGFCIFFYISANKTIEYKSWKYTRSYLNC